MASMGFSADETHLIQGFCTFKEGSVPPAPFSERAFVVIAKLYSP